MPGHYSSERPARVLPPPNRGLGAVLAPCSAASIFITVSILAVHAACARGLRAAACARGGGRPAILSHKPSHNMAHSESVTTLHDTP